MTHDEVTKAHTLLVKHIMEFDPKVISPTTRDALNAAERLARVAHAYAHAAATNAVTT